MMAMGTNMLMLMFIIDVFMYFGGSAVCDGCSMPTLSIASSFGLNVNDELVSINETNPASELSHEVSASTGVFSGQILTTVFNTFVLVVDFVLNLFAFVFAPVFILNQVGMPAPVVLALGGGWSLLFLLALLALIRGGEF